MSKPLSNVTGVLTKEEIVTQIPTKERPCEATGRRQPSTRRRETAGEISPADILILNF